MLKKETTGLRHLVAFLTSNTVFFNNKIEVGYDVSAGNSLRQKLLAMGKKKTHLLQIITDCTGRIVLGS